MNPFTLGIVEKPDDFCNREQEQKELLNHARNGAKVVISSPRRFGKSSLMMRVLSSLEKEGVTTAYVDLFPISSEEDFISRLGASLMRGIGKNVDPRSLVQKWGDTFKQLRPKLEVGTDGYSLSVEFDKSLKSPLVLDDLLEGLYSTIKRKKLKVCIVLDEFQEITELAQAKKIEGILRSHIQKQREVSYFFVGSRRRVLQDMFSDQRRPFYKSTFFYVVDKIPLNDFGPYLQKQFQKTRKNLDFQTAAHLYNLVRGYPYYVQKLAFIAWDLTDKECDQDKVEEAYRRLIETESSDFEGQWQGLTNIQKSALKAMAMEPISKPYAQTYLGTHRISLGGMQKALKILVNRDFVEKSPEGLYRLTDPIFEAWILEKNKVRIQS